MKLFQQYDTEKHLRLMKSFTGSYLTEHQFAQFLGKSRLYQCLPAREKKLLPSMELMDSQVNIIARRITMMITLKRNMERMKLIYGNSIICLRVRINLLA